MKKDILSWARSNIEAADEKFAGRTYRVSARLRDGTILACVKICPSKPRVDLAVRRLEETRKVGASNTGMGYLPVLRSFVCAGSRVSEFEIEDVWECDFAIPVSRLKEIGGETAMSWTAFVCVMDDGNEFSFGTSFGTDFFSMPEGYTAKRIVRIIKGTRETLAVYREKPHFLCYMDYDE
jgi:hypothetical protein